ncbi:MAG: transketolase family protein [Pseudomonadota bacterium]|nr:transketolase family protein [Pseudomonadota bacterium]
MEAPPNAKPALFDCRQAFADTLIALAEADPRIVAVCNDSVGSSNLGAFQKQFPERLINVGIAEQNMVGVGAGLAIGGYIPFVCAAAPFLTGRALEQVKVDVAYNALPVVLCGMSPGMAYGELGPTHHSIEDLSWLRAIDGLAIVVPADPAQTAASVRWAAAAATPCYLRVGRTKVPSVSADAHDAFSFGRIDRLRAGTDLTIVATGAMVARALAAAEALAQRGLQARVLNVATIKPLDEAVIVAAARETGAIVTVEEAMIEGGLGAAVAEIVVRHAPAPMRLLGVKGFAPTGSAEFLFDHFGLNCEGIVAAALDLKGR